MKSREEMDQRMPDLSAREPAEGDLDFEPNAHLCCPDEDPSSSLPVEQGGLAEDEGVMGRAAR